MVVRWEKVWEMFSLVVEWCIQCMCDCTLYIGTRKTEQCLWENEGNSGWRFHCGLVVWSFSQDCKKVSLKCGEPYVIWLSIQHFMKWFAFIIFSKSDTLLPEGNILCIPLNIEIIFFYWMFSVHFHNLNNILQRIHFQYFLYYVFSSTPTCFGPIGPSSWSYVQ
jgi:hypothetical protein